MRQEFRGGHADARGMRWWPELGWVDGVSFGLISALLLTYSIVQSRSRLFWSDESFSYMLLRDPVLGHNLRGWWEGADSGGLLYYLIGHVWFRVFGASPMTLRLLSTTCFLVAIGMTWVMARRVFAVPLVAVATALTFFVPSYLLWQEVNGRFYGLFLASAALTCACTMYAVEWRGSSRWLTVLLCCAHACLIGSHLLGVVYSAGLLLALVLSDVYLGERRLSLYLSVALVCGLMVLLSYHSIHATAMTAQGVFWPRKPAFRELVLGFFAYSKKFVLLAALLLLLAWVRHRVWPRSNAPSSSEQRTRYGCRVIIGGLILGQLAIFCKSRVGVSVYSDRYLLPLVIALVLVFCAAFQGALGPVLVSRLSRVLPALLLSTVAIGACFAVGIRSQTYDQLYAGLDYPAKLEARLPGEKTVVVTFLPVFMFSRMFDPSHQYIFSTDWGYDGATVGADLSGQRMMENVQRGGFAPHEVLDLPEIVREYPEFTLLAEPERLPWLKARFPQDHGFVLTESGVLPDWYPMTIWQVRCVHPASGCSLGMPPAAGKPTR